MDHWTHGAARFAVAQAAIALALALPAAAQAHPHPTIDPHEPAFAGKWSGPWQLAISPYVTEITNACVLPYESGHVLFWCRNNACDATNNMRPTETWLWDPSQPGLLPPPLIVPNGPDTDLFCCGATFDADGNLIAAGGHDSVRECLSQPTGEQFYGTSGTFRFPFVPGTPPGSQGWQSLGSMTRSRWYPTVMALADGSVLVAGHFNQPDGFGPITVETIDRWVPGEGWNPQVIPNRIVKTPSGVCGDGNLKITDYPRMFLLARTGETMIATGVNSLTAFLRPNDPTCPTYPWRWRVNGGPEGAMLAREGGPAVHFVLLDDADPAAVHDVVYAIAGAVHDDSCLPAPYITATVDKMRDPDVTKSWDQSAPDLNVSRSDANAVVLLDGSILVVGGYGDMVAGACPSRLRPELYRPPEIFQKPSAWTFLAPQRHERRYHSVAGLLPDGRVFSAGGTEVAESFHSVEIFEPPYLHQGPRPAIASLSTTEWSWNHPVKLGVALPGGGKVARAALLRPGAITHAFDSNQRYVQLRIIDNAGGQLTLQTPKHWNVAPPGYYFLTVVDTEGRPSPGRLVHLH